MITLTHLETKKDAGKFREKQLRFLRDTSQERSRRSRSRSKKTFAPGMFDVMWDGRKGGNNPPIDPKWLFFGPWTIKHMGIERPIKSK